MYKVVACYTMFDRYGDKDMDYDVFYADTKEQAEKIVDGLDQDYYDYIEIQKVIK